LCGWKECNRNGTLPWVRNKKNTCHLNSFLNFFFSKNSENGQYVTYGAMSRKPLSLPASLLIFKNISFHGFWVSKWCDKHSQEERFDMLKDITDLMSQGKLEEPKWTQVQWDEETMKQSVDQGISGFATGKQVVIF
jgi:trans-2-enoyl-CoA reductase